MNRITRFIHYVWESPTFTTWGSFLSKSLYAILLLPVIATVLSAEEITVWLLFIIFVGLQNIGDMGFGVTFVRVISYAMGGARDISSFGTTNNKKRENQENWELIDKTYSTTRRILFVTSMIFLLFLLVIGYLSLKKPIGYLENQQEAWIASIVVLVATTIRFNGNRFSIFLQGTNHVAMLRRWEAIISLCSLLTNFVVIVTTKSLLYLVISQQAWSIILVLFNRYLCRTIFDGRFKSFRRRGIDKELFKVVIPVAMRSWVGMLMSYGVVQASGIIVAQMGNTPAVAAYLFSLKILDMIKNFSNAPFYSKIPLYNRLFFEGNMGGLIARVKNGMRFTLMTFVVVSIVAGLFGNFALDMIGSNVRMVGPVMWLVMVMAYFFERYGGLHIQFYTITNKIIWHISSGVSGAIFIGASVLYLFVFKLDIISFPLALLTSSLSFLCWYAAKHTYGYFKLNFLKFEAKTTMYPLLILILYFVFTIIVYN